MSILLGEVIRVAFRARDNTGLSCNILLLNICGCRCTLEDVQLVIGNVVECCDWDPQIFGKDGFLRIA